MSLLNVLCQYYVLFCSINNISFEINSFCIMYLPCRAETVEHFHSIYFQRMSLFLSDVKCSTWLTKDHLLRTLHSFHKLQRINQLGIKRSLPQLKPFYILSASANTTLETFPNFGPGDISTQVRRGQVDSWSWKLNLSQSVAYFMATRASNEGPSEGS